MSMISVTAALNSSREAFGCAFDSISCRRRAGVSCLKNAKYSSLVGIRRYSHLSLMAFSDSAMQEVQH